MAEDQEVEEHLNAVASLSSSSAQPIGGEGRLAILGGCAGSDGEDGYCRLDLKLNEIRQIGVFSDMSTTQTYYDICTMCSYISFSKPIGVFFYSYIFYLV